MDKKRLLLQALGKLIGGLLLIALLLFVPAGSFRYFNAWLLISVVLIVLIPAGIVLILKKPELARKRLAGPVQYSDQQLAGEKSAGERRSEQIRMTVLGGILFPAAFFLAGLGFRLKWYLLPWSVSAAGVVLFLFSFVLYMEVFRENSFLSTVIEVQAGQKVIDTGLYGIVRHPMYAVCVLILLSMALMLGSVYSLALFCLYPLILAKRIRDEEAYLSEHLPGYAEYRRRVRYRLIPLIW